MPRFKYTALDASGGRSAGTLEAADEAAALDTLWQQGLTPVDVASAMVDGSNVPWWKRDIAMFGTGVPKSDLVVFFRSLATLAEAKLPLNKTLEILRKQSRNARITTALNRIIREVENGRKLTDAMQEFGQVFPADYVSILRVGERSNSLIEAAKRTARLAQDADEVEREVRSALIYPALLMILSIAVLALIVFHLAPTLQTVFVSSNADVPGSLSAMITVRSFLVDSWIVLAGGIIGLCILAIVFKKRIGATLSRIAFRAPVTGRYIKKRETGRLAETLSAMLSSGARLDEALETVGDALRTAPFRDLIDDARDSIASGHQLSEVLGSAPIVDPILRDILSAAEEGDAYAAMLQTAAMSLSSDTRASLQSSIKLITPILTIGIALAVGGLILTTITAILDLNELAF